MVKHLQYKINQLSEQKRHAFSGALEFCNLAHHLTGQTQWKLYNLDEILQSQKNLIELSDMFYILSFNHVMYVELIHKMT
jgi:tryptophan 2,3-dioxygenase